MKRKTISIWGSTGSIGTQTLDVISRHSDLFSLFVLTAHHNIDLLYKQAEIFKPRAVVVTARLEDKEWQQRFNSLGVEVWEGKKGLIRAAERGEITSRV